MAWLVLTRAADSGRDQDVVLINSDNAYRMERSEHGGTVIYSNVSFGASGSSQASRVHVTESLEEIGGAIKAFVVTPPSA